MSRRAQRRAWDDWARVDPLWAILTEPTKDHGGGDERAFFESGRDAVSMILAEAARLGRPREHRVALDFGCGIGRLTQAIAGHFETTFGLDIAPTMIERAQRLAADAGVDGCEYLIHVDDDLARFADGSVDFVCSLLVLQHLPAGDAITTYVREFVRVLAPGGIAVFQLPTDIPGPPRAPTLRARLGLRRRLTGILRSLGASPRVLYERLGWTPPMPMSALPESSVRDTVGAAGGTVLGTTPMAEDHGGVRSALYYVAGVDA
jgi:SAM-dependent methyltransferase